MAKDWYAPREIWFFRATALWLIQNLGSLETGHWPPDAFNYIDIPGKKTGKHKAPFETPIDYAVEIEDRLEKCGIDGLILEALECWGKSEESLAKYFRMPVWSIRKRAKRALAYVASGQDRRWHDTNKRKGETYQGFISREKRKWTKITPK